MVKYQSDGIFEASVDRVWKLLSEEHGPEHLELIHGYKGVKILEQTDTKILQEIPVEGPDGSMMTQQIQFDLNPPQGHTMSWLTGPLKGSSCTHTYTPTDDGKCRVELVGDFVAEGIEDEQVLAMVDEMMTTAFDQDNAFMKENP